MRLFYASFLSPGNREAYESLVARVVDEVPGSLRPVPPGTHHLTHAFLGEIADGRVEGFLGLLEGLAEIPAIRFALGSPGVLMGRGSPRLVKVDLLEGAEQVSRLQEQLRRELQRRDPSLSGRSKPPHVTIARFPRNARRHAARRVEESLSRLHEASGLMEEVLSRVELVRSRLTPEGPIYESLGEVSLLPL